VVDPLAREQVDELPPERIVPERGGVGDPCALASRRDGDIRRIAAEAAAIEPLLV